MVVAGGTDAVGEGPRGKRSVEAETVAEGTHSSPLASATKFSQFNVSVILAGKGDGAFASNLGDLRSSRGSPMTRTVYINGEFVPENEAKISVMD
ncbi:MAG: hypothetical protein CMM48_02335 [Rhodospirillaceae bacterium]|nr:hypothetical protein [Rhodospirillaceae bacterium]HAA91819.1 hypothetical protein [Rhodospirillaceae bacterium]